MAAERYVSKGIAFRPLAAAQRDPVQVSFVLAPNFTMLAFTSAFEPLRIANQLSGRPLFSWHIYTGDGQPVECSGGLRMTPDGPLPETVANGYVFIVGGTQPTSNPNDQIANWVRKQWRLGRTVGSLCTGAYVLAKAGILNGRKFAMHWEHDVSFAEKYPHLTPVAERVCLDSRILTCAGGVAAIELALKIIEDEYGKDLIPTVRRMCLIDDRQNVAGARGNPDAGATGNAVVARALAYIDTHLPNPVDLDNCADRANVSRRQLERLFKQYLDRSPKAYIADLRLSQARALLAESAMTTLEVAIACGFNSTDTFLKAFKKRYGATPHHFRMSRA